MSEAIVDELYFFLHAALTGVVLSAVYDAFRILRRVYTHGWFLIAVEDFFYWLGSALYITMILMKDNDGIIRWFFVIGILLGMFIYNITISQHLVGLLAKIINKVLNVVQKVLKVVLKPISFLLIKYKKIAKKNGKICGKLRKNLKKGLKKCCKTIRIGLSRK